MTHIDNLALGMRIGRSVYDTSGRALAETGDIVGNRLLQDLRLSGVSRVYTLDPLTDDFEVVDVLSDTTRLDAYSAAAEAFEGRGAASRLRAVCVEMVREVQASQGAVQGAVPIYPLQDYLVAHCVHSAVYALLIAAELRLPASTQISVAMGMLVHDIGCAGVGPIGEVPGRLTEAELLEFQQHTRHGFEMLRELLSSAPLGRSIALYHHERTDGSGYPGGATGAEIPEPGRIAAVADAFAAMVSDRHHRPARLNDEAFSYLLSSGAGKFDRALVARLATRVEIYPAGVWVRLRDGSAGVVLGSRRGATVRPIVRLLEDADRDPIDPPENIDLSDRVDLFIADVFYD